MIIGVDHAQITIPKGFEKEAKKFYCEFLGLKEIEKPENRKKNGGFLARVWWISSSPWSRRWL